MIIDVQSVQLFFNKDPWSDCQNYMELMPRFKQWGTSTKEELTLKLLYSIIFPFYHLKLWNKHHDHT